MIARVVLILAAAAVGCNALDEKTTTRKAYFEGLTGRYVGRTNFEGVFEKSIQVGGLSDLEADRDPAKSPKDEENRKMTAEDEADGASWRTVNPSGVEVEHELPLEVVRALLFDPKDFLKRPASEEKDEDPNAVVGEDREKALGGTAKGRDIDEARGRVGVASAILGADQRTEVSPASWRPAKQSGHLTFNGGSCSGALIGPKHVLTAGHCVHSGGRNGDWFGGFRFSPGRSSAGIPSGTYGWSKVSTFRGWTRDRNSDYDLAVITLSTEVTGGVGWLSFGWHSGMSSSWYVYHKGYSGDKPWGSQWSTHGSVSNVWSRRFYTDTTDTVGGNSGGPVYKYNGNGRPVIYGPHSGWNAYWYWWGARRNRHTRITSSVFATMCDWIDDARVC